MTDLVVAMLKLEAVERVAERLLRLCADAPDESCVYYPIAELGSELRGIVETVFPLGPSTATPTEKALAELALWAGRHARAVDAESLAGALLSEVVSIECDAGSSREHFLSMCATAYDTIAPMRRALDAAELAAERAALRVTVMPPDWSPEPAGAPGCDETGCVACAAPGDGQ
jgi:hypothetical protein